MDGAGAVPLGFSGFFMLKSDLLKSIFLNSEPAFLKQDTVIWKGRVC